MRYYKLHIVLCNHRGKYLFKTIKCVKLNAAHSNL